MAYTSPPSQQYTLIEPFSERSANLVCQADVIPWMPPLDMEDGETVQEALDKPLLSYNYAGLFIDTTTFEDTQLYPSISDSTTISISSGRALVQNVYYELDDFTLDTSDVDNYLDSSSEIGTFILMLLRSADPDSTSADLQYSLIAIESYVYIEEDPSYLNFMLFLGYVDIDGGEPGGDITDLYTYDENFPMTNRRIYPISPVIYPELNGGVIGSKGFWQEDW